MSDRQSYFYGHKDSTSTDSARHSESAAMHHLVGKKQQSSLASQNDPSSRSVPPHLRGSKMSGHVTVIPKVPGAMDTIKTPSISSSPTMFMQQDLSLDQISLPTFKPHFITKLQAFSGLSKIPAASELITFHSQFLEEHLGGTDWSPGLRYVLGDRPCILKNRTYYMLDPATEPYMPERPGQHGAKLTAFFNEAPEDVFGALPGGLNSYENVPLFVEQKDSQGCRRYAYFGHYSQTRWSDKLDFDTMVARVPQSVREFWAKQLSTPARQDWLTEKLKNHFYRKPTYPGRIYAAVHDPDTVSVASEEEANLNDKMARDVREYIEELREWERDAATKMSMINKQFILDAFDAADAADPPALRLWWEYLECTDWRQDFYDFLVTLQSRAPEKYLR